MLLRPFEVLPTRHPTLDLQTAASSMDWSDMAQLNLGLRYASGSVVVVVAIGR